jgi:NADH-quinone oxidoreductase subunit M
VFHGVPEGANAAFREMTWRERAVMAPLVLLIVGLGVYPGPVLERIAPAVDNLIAHVEEHSDYQQPAVAAGRGR